MFDSNYLNSSLSSFEENNNEKDFMTFLQFSPKNYSLFEQLSIPFSQNILSFSSFEEYPNNNLNKEIFKFSKSINNYEQLSQTTLIQNDNTIQNKKNKIESESPIHYTFDKIQLIIKSLDLPNEVKSKIVQDSYLNRIDRKMGDKALIGKKKRRKKGKIKFTEESECKKIGRKKANDYSKRKHNRNSGDNIIKKIKLKFIEYSLKFLNNILNSFIAKNKIIGYMKISSNNKRYYYSQGYENLIKTLDYKFIDRIKKDKELSLLKLPLKEIFSNNISPKYSTLPPEYNKNMIRELISKENENAIIMFAFNLTLEEWIDIFTHKRKLEAFENLSKENIKEIDNKFDKVEKLIVEMYQKNNYKNYLSYLISYMFNYKRWFLIKKGRNRITNKVDKI